MALLGEFKTANLRAFTAKNAEKIRPVDLPDSDFREPSWVHRGCSIHWTGWKGSYENRLICGQWIAWTGENPTRYFYVAVPGSAQGEYLPGAVFDIFKDLELGIEEKMMDMDFRLGLLEEGRDRMVALLDSVLPPVEA